MLAVKEWFHAFLRARGMEKANGQMLFRYRATKAEYRELREIFSERFASLRGSPWRHDSNAESALFVLYASEWWRREYEGGAWRWTSILDSLTSEPYRVDPLERSVIVELGLRAWGHRPSEDGKKYLGAIVAQGGLPLKLLARGDGVISRLLLSASRKAQLLGWGETQLVAFFESHGDDLVQHVRAAEIYRLLSEMVMTVLSLRGEYKLAGHGDPVSVLEQFEPTWRERFPIAVDDQSVDALLVGLVREVSRQIKMATSFPVSVVRSLVKLAEADSYALSMAISMPSSISVEALASAMQLAPTQVPQTFVLELVGEQRLPLGSGRQLLGANSSTVLLSGRPRRFLGKAACQEVLLALRSVGADVVSPVSAPGGDALDDSQPWVFEEIDGTLTLAGVGSCKVANNTAYVLVTDQLKVRPLEGASMELVGLVEELPAPRWMYKVAGEVSIESEDDIYTLRTRTGSGPEAQLVWRGMRIWYPTRPFPVYLGVPRLYRIDGDGHPLPVADKDLEWSPVGRKGQRLLGVKTHRGPVDAWWLVDGQRQRRFRMVLAAPDARLSFRSGGDECEGAVEFHGWGISTLHTSPSLVPKSTCSDVAARLEMHAQSQPPATVSVTAEWSPALPVLRIDVPFPASGGRFALSDGCVLANGMSLTLKRAHDVRVQVFDRNPSTPKRYRLRLQLLGDSQGSRMRRAEIALPLDVNGIGELRFFEIESNLNGLLAQSDHLDACLEISLVAGTTSIRTLRINRYDLALERESHSLAIPGKRLVDLSVEQLQGINLCAIPLLERKAEPRVLEQVTSADEPVGRWSLATLPDGHSPWLIYPGPTSTVLVRPTLWSATAFDRLGTLYALGDSSCHLAKAMSLADPVDRDRALLKVVSSMATDLDHPSWNLVSHHFKHLMHLPLNTLDYWRVIGRIQEASLAAVLKFPSILQELMLRMTDELGVVWELTSRNSLTRGYDALHESFVRQLGPNVPPELMKQLACDVYTKIGSASEALATQIDRIVFEKSGVRSPRFERWIQEYRLPAVALLDQLWTAQDSHLQRVLLRNHTEEKVWPFFKLWEELVKEINAKCDDQQRKFLTSLGSKLLWIPPHLAGGTSIDVRLDVANAPLLIGYLTQICDANNWLQTGDHMGALRQIKSFDPIWFEIGLQSGNLLAVMTLRQNELVRRSST